MSLFDTDYRRGLERQIARFESKEGPDSEEAKWLKVFLLLMDRYEPRKQEPCEPRPADIWPSMFRALATGIMTSVGRPLSIEEILMELRAGGFLLAEDAAEKLKEALLSPPAFRLVDGCFWLSEQEIPKEHKDTETRH